MEWLKTALLYCKIHIMLIKLNQFDWCTIGGGDDDNDFLLVLCILSFVLGFSIAIKPFYMFLLLSTGVSVTDMCMSVLLWPVVHSLTPLSQHWNRLHLSCFMAASVAAAFQHHKADTPASTTLWRSKRRQSNFHLQSTLIRNRLTWLGLMC